MTAREMFDAVATELWQDVKDAEKLLLDDPHSIELLMQFRAEMAAFCSFFSGERTLQ